MNLLKPLIFAFLTLVFVCCKQEESKDAKEARLQEQYYRLENIGWKSKTYEQNIEDIQFKATEVPIQYYLLKSQGNQNLTYIDSLYQANKTERVIEFVFQQEDEKDLLQQEFTGMDYTQSVKYMSFGLEKDFYVVTSKNDTIACSGVTYERNYKIAPYQKVLLYFSGIQPEEKVQLIYTDYLFRKGTIKFQFKDTYTPIAL